MYVRENDDLQPVPVDEALTAVDRGLRQVLDGRSRRRGALAFLDGRGSLPDGPLYQGPEPGQCAGPGAGPTMARTSRSSPTRPRDGPATPASSSRVPSRSMPRNAPIGGVSRRSSSISRGRSSPSTSCPRESAGEFQGLYVASDAIDPWIDEAASRALRSKVGFLIVQDTNVTPLAHLADVVLAGGDVRREGRMLRQCGRAAAVRRGRIAASRGSLPDLDLFAILLASPRRPGPLGRGPGRAGRDGSGVCRRPRWQVRRWLVLGSLGSRRATVRPVYRYLVLAHGAARCAVRSAV